MCPLRRILPIPQSILGIVLVLAMLAAPALAAPCPAGPEPRVSVSTEHDPPPVTDTLSIAEIAPMAARALVRGDRSVAVGLSVSRLGLELQWVEQVLPLRDGTVCGAVASLTAVLSFRETHVYVAREVAGDPCLRAEVLGHEHKHVATDQAILDDWAPRLRRRLTDAAAGLSAVAAGGRSAVGARIKAVLSAAETSLAAEMKADLTRRQAAVDSSAEYARVAASCGGRLAKLIGQPAL